MKMQKKIFSYFTVFFISISTIVISGHEATAANREISFYSINGLDEEKLFKGENIRVYLPLCMTYHQAKYYRNFVKLQLLNAKKWSNIGKSEITKNEICANKKNLNYIIRSNWEVSDMGLLSDNLSVANVQIRMKSPNKLEPANIYIYRSAEASSFLNDVEDLEAEKSGDIEKILSPLKQGKLETSDIGIVLKRAKSPQPIYSKNINLPFEPASSIKTLVGFTLMREVALGKIKLDDSILYFNYPNSTFEGGKDTCPIKEDEISQNKVSETISDAYKMMMRDSDNRTTRAFVQLLGVEKIQKTAKSLGMTSTEFQQDRIGCGWSGGKKNSTTLTDLSLLYENTLNVEAFSQSSIAFQTFWNGMTNGSYNGEFTGFNSKGKLEKIINEEAQKIGLSNIAIDEFKQKFILRGKGGSYDFNCESQKNKGCDYFAHKLVNRSFFLSVCIPIKVTRSINEDVECDWHQGGWFLNNMILRNSVVTWRQESIMYTAFLSLLRSEIARGLKTFIA